MSGRLEIFDTKLEFLARLRGLLSMDAIFEATTQNEQMNIYIFEKKESG